jgi:hypothetical protein
MDGSPSRVFNLILLEGDFAICQLDAASDLPDWVFKSDLYSITRTSDELSIICRHDQLPESLLCEPGWRLLKIKGSFTFDEIGVLSALLAPLAAGGISILAISTFNTDYLLIKTQNLDQAVHILQEAGHKIEQAESI